MTLTQLFSIAKPITFLVTASFGVSVAAGAAQAAERAAVFEFELTHGDLVPGAPNSSKIDRIRARMVSDRLRDHLAESGFEMVDIAPVAGKAAAFNLYSCGNCADDFAREIGARYVFTGTVYKISELILSIKVVVRDAETAQPVTSAAVDLRGNTDESWRRGIDYLFSNVLSARLEALNQ